MEPYLEPMPKATTEQMLTAMTQDPMPQFNH
jgi:hypothetical protein